MPEPDYAELAKQFGGATTLPASTPPTVDYGALAAQAGGKAAQPSSAPATQQPASDGGLGGWLDRNINPQLSGVQGDIAKGGIKMVSGIPAWLLDLASPRKPSPEFAATYQQQHPNATPEDIETAWLDPKSGVGPRIAGHLRDAHDWLKKGSDIHGLWESVGAIGEQMLEYLGPKEFMTLAEAPALAARGVEALEAGTKAAKAAETIKTTQQTMQTMQNNKRLTGLVAIGLKAISEAAAQIPREAAAMGAQTYVHTEDPKQAAEAAAIGGAAPLAMAPLTIGGRYLMARAPQMITRLGETFPVMRGQLNEAGEIEQGNVRESAPSIYQAQQAALPGMMRNVARRAVNNALEIVNRGRNALTPAIENPARLLPPPEGSRPFIFSLEAAGPAEQTEGTMAQSAAKVPGRAAFKEPQYTTSSAPTREPIRPGGPTKEEGQEGADILSATTPEAAADVTRAGTMQTRDPHQAVKWMNALDERMASDSFDELSEAEHNAIKTRRDSLSQQLKMYYSSPYARQFGPENIPKILDHVGDFGEAQAQLQHVAEPVFQVMDDASKGEFSSWRDQVKAAQKVIRNSTSIEAVEKAMQREAEGNGKIMELIDRNRDRLSFDDYIAAKNTWRQSARLGELHARFERMMNGITREESEVYGKTRMMKRGNTEAFNRYLDQGTNRAQIEELIGKDGIKNLKDITDMFANEHNNRVAQEVGQNTLAYMRDHGLLSRIAVSMGGMGAAGLFGLPGSVAAGAGGATYLGVEGTRLFLRFAATNPMVGNMLKTAVEHGISPKIYAPLIARTIAESAGVNKPTQKPEEEEQPATQ